MSPSHQVPSAQQLAGGGSESAKSHAEGPHTRMHTHPHACTQLKIGICKATHATFILSRAICLNMKISDDELNFPVLNE